MMASSPKQILFQILRGIRSILENLQEWQAEDLLEVVQEFFQVNLSISTTNNMRAEDDLVTHLAEVIGGRGLTPYKCRAEKHEETNKSDGKHPFRYRNIQITISTR